MLSDWIRSFSSWSPQQARTQVLQGKLPRSMRVAGSLNLSENTTLRALPERLRATSINVSGCLSLRALPCELECRELIARDSGLENLPARIPSITRIDAQGCRRLRSVGAYDLQALFLRNCLALGRLPNDLRVRHLDLSRCPLWTELPASVVRSVEVLDVSECPQISELPDCFARLEGLNVSGCRSLTELPAGMRIRSWIDVADTGLRSLPWSLRSVRLLWHGVQVSDRVAFEPESITADEILTESNQEMRRVLLERMGMERFFAEVRPEVLDEDRDSGGQRRLLRISMRRNDEVIVCVQVQCPSTGHKYLLRVPPTMLSCHEAIAWTAGYANPRDYRPAVET